MTDTYWTPRLVEAHLTEAAEVLRCLPEVRARGFISKWPAIIRDRFELAGSAEGPTPAALPSPRAISAMERTLLWLRGIEREDQRIVWYRANRRPWKAIAY